MPENPPWKKTSSPWWILVTGFLIIWTILAIFFDYFKELSIVFFSYIFSDIQMTMAFCLFIFLTLGWVILEKLAIFFNYIVETAKKEFVHRLVTMIRFFTILLLSLTITFRYITIWDYTDPPMYIVTFLITTLVGIIYFKGGLEPLILKSRGFKGMRFSSDCKAIYIPYTILVYLFITVGFSIVFVWYYFNGEPAGVFWVKEFVDHSLVQFIINPFMLVLLILFLIFTIFYPLVQLIVMGIRFLSFEMLSDKVKKRIKTTRMWSLVFLIVSIFLKYILSIIVDLDDWLEAIISLAATFIYGFLAVKARSIAIK